MKTCSNENDGGTNGENFVKICEDTELICFVGTVHVHLFDASDGEFGMLQ